MYSMPSESGGLYQYVERTFLNHEVHLAYETGCSGFSVTSYFLNLGGLVLVVNPADVKKGDKERYQKTDVLDSKKSIERTETRVTQRNLHI